MCGRFNLFSSIEMIVDDLNVERALFYPPPRYNICPGQDVVSVHRDDVISISAMRWGLVPHWSTGSRGMVNARSETIFKKRSFRDAALLRRCLLPADGFFEWGASMSGKQPYFIRREDGSLLYLAGIFEEGSSVSTEVTCSIITVPSSGVISSIHDRMPLILGRDDALNYIDADPSEEKIGAYFGKGVNSLAMHKVSKDVNHPSAEGRSLIEPIANWF